MRSPAGPGTGPTGAAGRLVSAPVRVGRPAEVRAAGTMLSNREAEWDSPPPGRPSPRAPRRAPAPAGGGGDSPGPPPAVARRAAAGPAVAPGPPGPPAVAGLRLRAESSVAASAAPTSAGANKGTAGILGRAQRRSAAVARQRIQRRGAPVMARSESRATPSRPAGAGSGGVDTGGVGSGGGTAAGPAAALAMGARSDAAPGVASRRPWRRSESLGLQALLTRRQLVMRALRSSASPGAPGATSDGSTPMRPPSPGRGFPSAASRMAGASYPPGPPATLRWGSPAQRESDDSTPSPFTGQIPARRQPMARPALRRRGSVSAETVGDRRPDPVNSAASGLATTSAPDESSRPPAAPGRPHETAFGFGRIAGLPGVQRPGIQRWSNHTLLRFGLGRLQARPSDVAGERVAADGVPDRGWRSATSAAAPVPSFGWSSAWPAAVVLRRRDVVVTESGVASTTTAAISHRRRAIPIIGRSYDPAGSAPAAVARRTLRVMQGHLALAPTGQIAAYRPGTVPVSPAGPGRWAVARSPLTHGFVQQALDAATTGMPARILRMPQAGERGRITGGPARSSSAAPVGTPSYRTTQAPAVQVPTLPVPTLRAPAMQVPAWQGPLGGPALVARRRRLDQPATAEAARRLDAPGRVDRAERFSQVLRRRGSDPAVALPRHLHVLARTLAGPAEIKMSSGPHTRAALAAAGRPAATVGRVIHLASHPDASARTAEIVGHELVHAARPSSRPRFFDDDRHSAEEALAQRTGGLIRSLAAVAGGPPGMATHLLAPLALRRSALASDIAPTRSSNVTTSAVRRRGEVTVSLSHQSMATSASRANRISHSDAPIRVPALTQPLASAVAAGGSRSSPAARHPGPGGSGQRASRRLGAAARPLPSGADAAGTAPRPFQGAAAASGTASRPLQGAAAASGTLPRPPHGAGIGGGTVPRPPQGAVPAGSFLRRGRERAADRATSGVAPTNRPSAFRGAGASLPVGSQTPGGVLPAPAGDAPIRRQGTPSFPSDVATSAAAAAAGRAASRRDLPSLRRSTHLTWGTDGLAVGAGANPIGAGVTARDARTGGRDGPNGPGRATGGRGNAGAAARLAPPPEPAIVGRAAAGAAASNRSAPGGQSLLERTAGLLAQRSGSSSAAGSLAALSPAAPSPTAPSPSEFRQPDPHHPRPGDPPIIRRALFSAGGTLSEDTWSLPTESSSPPISPETMDWIIETIEQRVVEELERRGLRNNPGVF
jgi:hypothetical protein